MIVDLFAGPALLADAPPRGRKLPAGWTHKICPGCRFIHERAEYGTQSRCRLCRSQPRNTPARRAYRRTYYAANREKAIAQSMAWRRSNPDRWHDALRKSKYGIPYGTYARLLTEQEGRCAICLLVPDKSLHVDHDHSTGQVRGLLCDLCNRGLGYFADRPEQLRAAAQYLEEARRAQ